MDKFEEGYDDELDELDRTTLAATSVAGTGSMLNVNEEMGADFAVGSPGVHTERREDRDVERAERTETENAGYALGWVSLAFAIASWFLWPVLLGATATVLGFVAYQQGAKGLGGWTMAIGILAIALNLIIVPFYYAIT